MRTINVEGLPEPVVQAVETVVQTFREQFRRRSNHGRRCTCPFGPEKSSAR